MTLNPKQADKDALALTLARHEKGRGRAAAALQLLRARLEAKEAAPEVGAREKPSPNSCSPHGNANLLLACLQRQP